MSYSPYKFVLDCGAKEKMTLICVCQPWHPCLLSVSVCLL